MALSRYPGIVHPVQDNLLRAVTQLKESVEIGQRLRGKEGDSFVRYDELKALETRLTTLIGDTMTTGLTVHSLDVPAGNIVGQASVNKFGRASNIAAGDTIEIWDGNVDYTWPTTASIDTIAAAAHSSATGGMEVEIQGVDASFTQQTQTATLDITNSAAEITLGTPLLRVFRMKVLDSRVTDQDINIGPSGFATIQAVITAGNNQTLMAIYTVPAGKTAYITNYYATMNPATNKDPTSMQLGLWFRDNDKGYAPQLKHTMGLDTDATSHWHHVFNPYYRANEKTDIFITGNPTGKAADISAGFDIVLVDN